MASIFWNFSLCRLLNFYVKRTVRRQDFGAKFNLTYHNGAPVEDILKLIQLRFSNVRCVPLRKFPANNIKVTEPYKVHVPNFEGVSGSEGRGGGDNSVQFINIGRVSDKRFEEWRRKIGVEGGGG